jgi:hypothetical protein
MRTQSTEVNNNSAVAWEQFKVLPPERQQEVADFIEFLSIKSQSGQLRAAKRSRQTIAEENFVGIWADRHDMSDSTAWVKQCRTSEWERGR